MSQFLGALVLVAPAVMSQVCCVCAGATCGDVAYCWSRAFVTNKCSLLT